jgi:hypothetical protein
MNTDDTTTRSRSPRGRRVLAAAAAAGSVLAGTAATMALAPPAQAATTYIRFEQIIDRWAMNTGHDNGTFSEGASVQLWSWTHRDPHDWNSQWSWAWMGGEYYQYKNRWSGKCLDVSSLSFGARLVQSTCNASDRGQHWDDVKAGSHSGKQTYTLRNRGLTEKLGVTMAAESQGVDFGDPVNAGVLNGLTPQRWFFSYVTG